MCKKKNWGSAEPCLSQDTAITLKRLQGNSSISNGIIPLGEANTDCVVDWRSLEFPSEEEHHKTSLDLPSFCENWVS